MRLNPWSAGWSTGNGAMVQLLRHRQSKGAATDRLGLRPPRHILTLPIKESCGADSYGSCPPFFCAGTDSSRDADQFVGDRCLAALDVVDNSPAWAQFLIKGAVYRFYHFLVALLKCLHLHSVKSRNSVASVSHASGVLKQLSDEAIPIVLQMNSRFPLQH